jgi:hypothetical protein
MSDPNLIGSSFNHVLDCVPIQDRGMVAAEFGILRSVRAFLVHVAHISQRPASILSLTPQASFRAAK